MQTVVTKEALRAAIAPHRGGSIGFVPTMGYLHEGHMSLFRAARAANDFVVASIFVNPTQFAEGEDLDVYPRDPEGDSAKCVECGVDLLWMPPVDSVYAPDHSTTVTVEGITAGLCGVTRPDHFQGVATICTKLFNLVQPDRAYFGEKDFQQLAMIRRMVRDLDIPLEIVGMPIVREEDGIAMSSRNAYLSAEERSQGLALSRGLAAAEAAFTRGERDASKLRAAVVESIDDAPLARLDYAEVVDAETLAPLHAPITRPVVCAVAAHLGSTRLIDNRVLRP